MGEYAAWQVSRTPRFMAAMRAELDAALVGEGAPIAYNILKEILHDPARYNADTKTLVSAAKTLLNAVVAAPKAAEAPASAPEPSAMDTRALQAFVAQGMAELANRAKPIEPGDGDIFG